MKLEKKRVNEMTKKRKNNGSADEDRHVKSVKVVEQSSPSPPRLGFENPLLPLANTYDDDDEEEEYGGRGDSGAKVGQNGRTGEDDDEDKDEDEDDLANGYGQGQRSRLVEVRRDCPYLDTVNRQVHISCCAQWISF